ncbi:MAG: FAD:protein FMN transferase [Spirochaetales bacterium]|nr:FAD:protein FMN transferase [Spirochaetales bacterium]
MKHSAKKTAVLAVVLSAFLILACSCSRIVSSTMKVHSVTFAPYFDTVGQMYSFALDKEEEFNKNAESVSALLERWHRMLDIYNEYEGMNNLCTVNKSAGKEPVKVDPELIEFVQYAKQMCELTKGEMDISLGAVLKLWHDAGAAETPYVPSQADLEEAAKHVGFDKVEIDIEKGTIFLTDPAASLDPGALGKGYASERAAELLSSKEVSCYGINLGGNVRLLGAKADGSPFVVGIRDPQNPDQIAVTLNISDTACVTSGDYERFFTVGGVRYNHIIDKDTLKPADYLSSVTVICRDAALADALSTALFCMSFEDGYALVSTLENVNAIWMWLDGTINYTMGIESSMGLN